MEKGRKKKLKQGREGVEGGKNEKRRKKGDFLLRKEKLIKINIYLRFELQLP